MYSLILYGKSSIGLQKWRQLRFSEKLMQNVFSPFSFSTASDVLASPQDGQKANNFNVSSYLVDSLGLTTKVAESISRKVSSDDKGNPDSVLSLLRSHGFTDSQISTIITDYPGLLILDSEKSLGPKLKFLQSRGASNSELTDIVSKVPKILGMKEDKSICVYYDFIKEIIEADKSSKFEKLSHSLLPKGSQQENKIRNISVLRELGMPQKLLFSMLISNFGTVCGKEKFKESLKKVVELGFDPATSRFVQALNFVYQMSDKTIEEKVNVYKRLGFAEGDVWEIFKKWPAFLGYSEKKITRKFETFIGLGFSRDEFAMMVKRFPNCIGYSAESTTKKTEFLVKKMNWPLKAVVSYPQVFGLSMETRIVPRCNVIKALSSKRLFGDRGNELPSMETVVKSADKDFLERYVRKHDDKKLVAELMAIFNGDRAS